jgi:hypothetical protein
LPRLPRDATARAAQLNHSQAPSKLPPAGVLFAALLAELRTRQTRGELVWAADGSHCTLLADERTICLIHRQTEQGVKVQLALHAAQTITIHITDMQSAGLVGYLIARASHKTPKRTERDR